MVQVTLRLDDETAGRMKAAAEAEGTSQSRWVANLIRARVADEWPAQVVALAGAWSDLPTADQLRAGQLEDVPRESI
jgi:predicted transcriptional regulator